MSTNLTLLLLLQLFFSSTTLQIQPLGKVSPQHLSTIKQTVQSFYGYNCVVLPPKPHDRSLYAKSNTRYDAQKILDRFNSRINTVVVTEKDIAYRKDDKHTEWGILGLGELPGTVCVVSTHRLGSGSLLNQRLQKVVVHELGHNLGLPHCHSMFSCVMKDASGTIAVVDANKLKLCKVCRSYLNYRRLNF